MPSDRILRLLATGLVVLLAACGGSSAPSGARPGPDPYLLTEDEIKGTGLGNLYDVVQRLRPRWLSPRAASSMGGATVIGVYRGQVYLGGVGALRNEMASSASRVRFLDGATATASLRSPGPGVHLAGAIVIEVRR